MASSKETYCLCGQPYNIGQFMIECDCCREWFHGSCVDVKIYQSDDIDKYHCPKCAQTYGPSVLKIPTNNHRADRYELGAEARPAQAGSPAWVRALAARPARPLPAALQHMRPGHFTEEFVRDNGFTKPVMFHTIEGLDIKVPNPFTARSVLRYCGAQLEVEVIDVRKQTSLRMPLGEFVEYFEAPAERRADKVLNVISLEFSDTGMAALVEPPLTARKLDWAERAWPAGAERPPRPAVQKYCLLSAAGSYTDWHVDFGGTTVWYHLLYGKKIFYLAPPTATNLALYQQWSASNNQNERFFGDMVEWYGTAELRAGETLMIPSGWLHAVMTPRDSLVLGGNLLHSYAIETQLQVYEIERRVETPVVFRYPLFEAMHWYAGAQLLALLRRHNEESQDEDFTLGECDARPPPVALAPLLLRGVKILANALKEWHALKSTDAAKRDNVPKCLNSGQLVRELSKELRTLEKRSSVATAHKEFKPKNTSPNKAHAKKAAAAKKSLKLTLPKPIMHMAHNAQSNGEYPDDKLYADKQYVDEGKEFYQDPRYINDLKYADHGLQEAKTFIVDGKELKFDHHSGLQEAKTFMVDGKELVMTDKGYMYQTYEEQLPVYGHDANGFVEEKKNGGNVLRIKLNSSPSSSRDAPPPYQLPEHSILKSHLTGRPVVPPVGPVGPVGRARPQQWTISKRDSGDYQEEQLLFTNEHLQPAQPIITYGPGMYSAEDIQQDYQYSEAAKPGSYHPEYGYQRPYPEYGELTMIEPHTATGYEQGAAPAHLQGEYTHHELPSYDAAVAQHYTNTYIIEEKKPLAPPDAPLAPPAPPAPGPGSPAVRRSERPVRRRLSASFDYEDTDLYIDEAPAPRRRPRHKQHSSPRTNNVSNSGYRQPAARPAPANGIESLIQASVLAEEPPTATEDAAVAGMLSISEQRYTPQRTFGLAAGSPVGTQHSTPTSSKRSRRAAAAGSAEEDQLDEEDDEDVIKEVHRDDEYVYPSLEMSSDEDEEWTAGARRRRVSRSKPDSKSKGDKDESWSPRARLGRLVPRLRSGRAAVRRECVRAALHHARHAPATRHTHHTPTDKNAKRAVIAAKSRRPQAPAPPTPNKNNTRLKKGMKTAKQRLGKILKIHKMVY